MIITVPPFAFLPALEYKSPARDFLLSARERADNMDTEFDKDDIALGKRLVKQHTTNHVALGELANKIETKYGDGTLEDFAEVIGIAYSTLKNCRHVYRKWKNSPTKPKNFSVAKVLASYKDKDQYIAVWPNATEKEARAHVRAAKALARDKKEKEMLDAERKGARLGNWTKEAEKLIKNLQEILLIKWEHKLDLLSQRRNGINLGTVADIIMTLETSANMLLRYKDKFKASTMIKEYGDDAPPEAEDEESNETEAPDGEYTEEEIAEINAEYTERQAEKEAPQEDMGTRETPFRKGESDD
jgi:hypothetical protein